MRSLSGRAVLEPSGAEDDGADGADGVALLFWDCGDTAYDDGDEEERRRAEL
jgi:coenzyme F420-reducing hydrogenase delta subunit